MITEISLILFLLWCVVSVAWTLLARLNIVMYVPIVVEITNLLCVIFGLFVIVKSVITGE